MQYVLASNSPRRRELLSGLGIPFTVVPATMPEHTAETEPEKIVESLAMSKTAEVADRLIRTCAAGQSLSDDTVIISADTMVFCKGRALGKPDNEEKAREMITLLQGRDHTVSTGVSLMWVDAESADRMAGVLREAMSTGDPEEIMSVETRILSVWESKHFVQTTRVKVYPMTEEEIERYIETPEPYDKAGAYAIQGAFARYIEGIEGDYDNVVGLPVARLYQEMKKSALI